MKADLYLSGELSHHVILDAVSKNRTVIVCNHSNTERGYLKSLKRKLEENLGEGYEFFISKTDRDPLSVYFPVCFTLRLDPSTFGEPRHARNTTNKHE